MKREERYEFTYINKDGLAKTERVKSKEHFDKCLKTCEELHYPVVRKCKLYPFSTLRNQHNFQLIANICYNRIWDMEHDVIPYNADEIERLEARRTAAEEFFCYDLPVAWVPWETYKEMKELATAAICHRDEVNARARSAAENDYSASTPWNAPGMSVRDFI